METSLTMEAVVAPWRKATLVTAGIAIIEFTLVIALTAVLLGSNDGRAAAATRRHAKPRFAVDAPGAPLARPRTRVLVLNGNGQTGAAANAASHIRGLAYRVEGVANADRSNYRRSVVLYRSGRAAEAKRLAHDLGITLVGPLDGMGPRRLGRAHVAVILGR